MLTITDGTGSETYTYDILGRPTQVQKVIGTATYTIGYGYNFSGETTSITYPSNRVVQPGYDPIGTRAKQDWWTGGRSQERCGIG